MALMLGLESLISVRFRQGVRLSVRSRGAITILQLVGSLGIGGAERVAMEIAKGVSQMGWRSVVAPLTVNRNLPEYVDDLRQAGVLVKPISPPVGNYILGIVALIRELGPTLIHVHAELPELVGLIGKIVSPKSILVRTIHNTTNWPAHPILARLVPRFYGILATQQIACSYAVPGGFPVIMNGVRWGGEGMPQKTNGKVAFVGRMEKTKNPEDVIRITARVRTRLPHVQLHMVGDGSLYQQLRKRYSEDWIVWHGKLPDALSVLQDSCLLVMASEYEGGLPLVALEAISCMTPVVAPDVPGIPQFGWITRYPAGNLHVASDLAVQILSADTWMGLQDVREVAKRLYSVEAMVSNYLDCYRTLVANS